MPRLMVDGYNVIRSDPALSRLESRSRVAGRAELLRLLDHPALSRYTVIVVFDGTLPPRERLHRGRVRVVQARERSADEVIARSCSREDVVVTNDRELAENTLLPGPTIWSVERLLGVVRPHRARAAAQGVAGPEKPMAARLRRFRVCERCLFHTRDDWAMLCEEDSALGRPRNFREHW